MKNSCKVKKKIVLISNKNSFNYKWSVEKKLEKKKKSHISILKTSSLHFSKFYFTKA